MRHRMLSGLVVLAAGLAFNACGAATATIAGLGVVAAETATAGLGGSGSPSVLALRVDPEETRGTLEARLVRTESTGTSELHLRLDAPGETVLELELALAPELAGVGETVDARAWSEAGALDLEVVAASDRTILRVTAPDGGPLGEPVLVVLAYPGAHPPALLEASFLAGDGGRSKLRLLAG
jgi:hypothetical protein